MSNTKKSGSGIIFLKGTTSLDLRDPYIHFISSQASLFFMMLFTAAEC